MRSRELAHPSLQPQRPLPTCPGRVWAGGLLVGPRGRPRVATAHEWKQQPVPTVGWPWEWARRQPVAPVTGRLSGRVLAPRLAGCAWAESHQRDRASSLPSPSRHF